MSSSESLPQFVQFSDGVDSMGFWPQFPISDEQFDVNSQFDHDRDPPSKRARNSLDNKPMNHGNNHRSPTINPTFNQPTGRIFFKTRLCLKFRTGQCRNGENCNFAHGDEDLRKPPPNWQDLVSGRSDDRGNINGNGSGNGGENWDDDDRIIHKMKLCKKYYNGEECPYGERCNFLHKDPPNFRDVAPPPRFRDSSRESSAISIGTTGPPPMVQPRVADQFEVNKTAVNPNLSVDASRGAQKPVYWKTRWCTKYETTGFCPFGDNCHYAHGQAELLLPGGRPADSEPTIGNNAPLKAIPPPDEAPPVKTEPVFSADEVGQSKKCLLKWNATKKINRIYGDWIGDLNLPNEQPQS